MRLFIYNPTHPDSNSNGILENDILCATARLTGKEKGLVRFIVDGVGSHYYIDDVNNQIAEHGGWLRSVDTALSAKEGEEFRGWKKTKQYRLTKEEIEQFVVHGVEKWEGKTRPSYKVFNLCVGVGALPTSITGNTGRRGYLT